MTTADGRSLPLVGATLRGDARGGIARLVLEQRFENRYDETLHVTYRMPLPADGAVSGYAFAIGDRKIVGAIDKKHAARERFERAIVEGHTAGLLEQETADIFTQRLGNIGARETIVATITIDQRLAWLPEGEWELRFPTVIGPRYVGASDGPEVAAAVAIEVGKVGAAIAIEFAIHDVLAGNVSSPTHAIDSAPTAAVRGPASSEVRVALRDAARLDRDIVVRWPVARAEVGVSINHARTNGELAYGLVTIVPPQASVRHEVMPRDLIVLLDTSGSMDGVPLDLAKKVVAMVIDSLDDQDRLELIEFSNSPSRYTRAPIAATARAKRDAIDWVHNRTASGGTEMMAAVVEALASLRPGSQRQVVVVTDGYIGGEQRLVSLLGENLPPSCRLHVIGVGAAVNRSLATALSRAGRGTEVIVGPGEDPERGAKRLVDKTRRPVLTNLTIEGNAVLDHVPANLPDVFEGSPLVAAVALSATGGTLVVRGDLARGRWEKTIRIPAMAANSGDPAIVALYGRERVADFEARWNESLDAEIEATGLAYQIATRMTSWIAVDQSRKVTGPSRSENVPQELPFGTRAESFGLRSGTTMDVLESLAEFGAEEAGAGMAGDFDELGSLELERSRPMKTRSGSVPADGFARRRAKAEVAKESTPLGRKQKVQAFSVDKPEPVEDKKAGKQDVSGRRDEPAPPPAPAAAQPAQPAMKMPAPDVTRGYAPPEPPAEEKFAIAKDTSATTPKLAEEEPVVTGKAPITTAKPAARPTSVEAAPALPKPASKRATRWLVWLFILALIAAFAVWWML